MRYSSGILSKSTAASSSSSNLVRCSASWYSLSAAANLQGSRLSAARQALLGGLTTVQVATAWSAQRSIAAYQGRQPRCPKLCLAGMQEATMGKAVTYVADFWVPRCSSHAPMSGVCQTREQAMQAAVPEA